MRFILLLFFFLFSAFNYALSLKPDSPERYIVQPGDSLWTIAGKYLDNPWEWKALWRANPHIKNPNRLYAGDVLILAYFENKPYIRVLRNGVIKLSPNSRPMPLEQAIPAIPLGDLKPFLNESLVLDVDALPRAPYVVAFMGEHMMGGQGDEAYVKGLYPRRELPEGGSIAYSLFRQGANYIDPVTQEVLGFKASLVGYARLIAGGEPATILLTNINVGIKILDRVLMNDSPEFDLYFEPKAPAVPVVGQIIDMPDGMPSGNTQEAVGGVVVINRGERNGLEAGDVLGIYRKPYPVRDPLNSMVPIKLPPERIGEVMVFRVFTKTSFALIVRSTRAVYLYNTVTNP
jgi:hypothetical protein